MKRHNKVLACFMSMAVLSAGFVFKRAEKAVSADDQVAALTSQQNELDRQNEALNAKLSSLKNDIKSQKAYRASVNEKVKVLKQQINIESQKLELLNRDINEKQAQAEEIQREMDENTEALCKILRAVYKNGDTPELVVLFEVDDVDDFLEKADLIQRFSTHNAELIDSLKENGEKLAQDREIIERNKHEVEASTSSLEAKREELRNLQKECEKLLIGLQKEETKLQSQINANRAKRNQLASNNNSAAPRKSGRYMTPVRGSYRISSEFGRRGRGFHNGRDYAAPQGTPVIAVADGVVNTVNSTNRWGSGWGLHVKINHGDGYETIFAHLSKTAVSPGQHVHAGDVIGYVGSTGWSTGSHLHFGTSKNGTWYDPRKEL